MTLYNEARLAKTLGISRPEFKNLRRALLERETDWTMEGNQVVIKECGWAKIKAHFAKKQGIDVNPPKEAAVGAGENGDVELVVKTVYPNPRLLLCVLNAGQPSTVNVEQKSEKNADLRLRESQSKGARKLSIVPRGIHSTLEDESAPQSNTGTTLQSERSGLLEGVLEKGKDSENAMPGVRRSELANAPSELQPPAASNMALQAAPSSAPPNGEILVRVRVPRNDNFRPKMKIKARKVFDGFYELVGRCPRYPGRW